MGLFIKDAQTATDALFAHEPFKSKKDKFNIIAVKSDSEESGTSEPSKGIWKNTALSSHFDTFYSDRYLTTLHLKDVHNWLAGTPYEHIIILVNTEKYGGGGILNSYNLSMTHNEWFKPVVVHEFGHSLPDWLMNTHTRTRPFRCIHTMWNHGNRTSQHWSISKENGKT